MTMQVPQHTCRGQRAICQVPRDLYEFPLNSLGIATGLGYSNHQILSKLGFFFKETETQVKKINRNK